MNIRMRVKVSFALIVTMLLFLGVITALITQQYKENSNFRASIATILLMQEGMNDIIRSSTQITDVMKLKELNAEFIAYEKRFEALRALLFVQNKSHILNYLVPDIGADKTVQSYLNTLYHNEHRIEVLYDALFSLERQKLEYVTIFNTLYPEENRLRVELRDAIVSTNHIEQIKVLGDLRYYSKEMLYQHGDEITFEKWLSAIDTLLMLTQQETTVHTLLQNYKENVRLIGEKAIQIEQTKMIEEKAILEASKMLEETKKVSVSLEETIWELSRTFIDQMRWIQFVLGSTTILFIVLLALKVSRNVSLTMDEVETKIEEGLVEVNALNQEIEDTQKEVVFTMGSIGESRSKETGNHVKRVAEYSELLARYYGLPEEEAKMLKQASPMHDIGKVAIPDAILNKPGRFDEEERKIMDTHSMLGYEMLKHSQRPLLKMAAIIAKEHHEKWDGTGYPHQKNGEEIHIYGRITALADVFDALGSARVYKPAWDDEKIFALFKSERGKHFDPQLVDIFFDHLEAFLHIRESFKD